MFTDSKFLNDKVFNVHDYNKCEYFTTGCLNGKTDLECLFLFTLILDEQIYSRGNSPILPLILVN